MREANGAWRSSVDCSNDSRWAGNQPWQRVEDYHGRFGYAEDLCKDGAEASGRWPEGAAHGGVWSILEHLQTEPDLLQRVITGDESWIFEYDPETKCQSLQWKCPSSLRPKKARQSRSKIKLMLIAFFDARGIVHMEFLPQGQTVNQHVYKEILRRLLRSVREKRHELWQDNVWLLHQDNAPADALSIRQFLTERNVTVLDHPPYSPDLAPCDFFCSPSSRESVFRIWKPSRRPWRRNWNVSRKNPSRSAWRHGRTEWECVLDSKEITLKEKTCSLYRFLAINCLWPQSGTFLTHLVLTVMNFFNTRRPEKGCPFHCKPKTWLHTNLTWIFSNGQIKHSFSNWYPLSSRSKQWSQLKLFRW